MTIEPVIETGWTATSFRDVITAGRRLLLRPHGRSEGRVYRIMNTWYRKGPRWYEKGRNISPFDSSKMYWSTRAQAAQAASVE